MLETYSQNPLFSAFWRPIDRQDFLPVLASPCPSAAAEEGEEEAAHLHLEAAVAPVVGECWTPPPVAARRRRREREEAEEAQAESRPLEAEEELEAVQEQREAEAGREEQQLAVVAHCLEG